MYRIIISLLAAIQLFISSFAKAQVDVVAQSSYFDEPEAGSVKIINMKNKETAVVFFEHKGDIQFTMYDADHKKKFLKKAGTSRTFSLHNSNVLGIFETNGQIAAFFSVSKGKAPSLYRIILNTDGGKILSEETLGEQNANNQLKFKSTSLVRISP